MKFSLLAAALVAISLTACDRPKQAMPESIEGYGTHTEEGTSMIEEREASGPAPDAADPEKFKVDNAVQAEEAAEIAEAAAASTTSVTDSLSAAKSSVDAAKDSVNKKLEALKL
jgi:hypothetical protein